MRGLFFVFGLIFFAGDTLAASELIVVSFNVESGKDTEPKEVARFIREEFSDIDIWGLSEVENASAAKVFRRAAGWDESGSYKYVLGETGRSDRLQIIYNETKLERLDWGELSGFLLGRKIRAPLWARFRHREDGTEFLFVVNHLYRGNEQTEGDRHKQAALLNAWAKDQSLPIIAAGDYNFDWEVAGGTGDHDKGYDNLTAGGVFQWVRPSKLVKTQCNPEYDSVLDFVFVGGGARNWQSSSEILFPETWFCSWDEDGGADHRPVMARFQIP